MDNLGSIPVDVEVDHYHNTFTLIFRDPVYPSEALPFEPFILFLTFDMQYGDWLHWNQANGFTYVTNIYTYINEGLIEFVNLQVYMANWHSVHGVVPHQQVPVDEVIVISSDESVVSIGTTASL